MSAGEADTYIGPDLLVQGKLLGAGRVRIEGRLEGEVVIQGVLTVGTSARIVAPVTADAVSVAGEIVGRVEALTLVEVHAGGRIEGDVRAPQVTIDEGGQVTGNVEELSSGRTAVTEPVVFCMPSLRRVKARVKARRKKS